MNVLLLDDEPGIREGLAAILRRRGHRVRTAASLAAGLECLSQEEFELVVSDWRLPDGVAQEVLAASPCPVVVVSGHPDEVRGGDNLLRVLAKPVLPDVLVSLVAELDEACAPPEPAAAVGSDPFAGLPTDCAHLLRAAVAILRPASFEILDDGTHVTLRAPVPAGAEGRILELEPLGGDLRVLAPERGPVLELRVFRDCRPRADVPVLAHDEPWPAAGELALDLSGEPPAPGAFLRLLDRVAEAVARGRQVHLLNVPGHLRFFAEVSGKAHDMPIRGKAGPHLPEVLTALWS